MAKKMTIVEKFEGILTKYAEVMSKEDLDFLAERKEVASKKNSAVRKPTADQIANESIKTAILNAMEVGKSYTVTDLTKVVPECANFTTSKMSALVTQLKNSHLVVRSEIKGRAYFTLA